jgi:short subunit dehydrogenase-like uncharacterized protein
MNAGDDNEKSPAAKRLEVGGASNCSRWDHSDKVATPGGFWTPATIFGDRLIQRLTAHSGLTFDLVPDL